MKEKEIEVQKREKFTVISNHVLQNKNLSLKAIGLFAFMWSLPDTWDYSVSGLSKVLKEGRDSISVALKELEQEGFLTRIVTRKDGRFSKVKYSLHDYQDPFRDNHISGKEGQPEEEKKAPVKKKSYAMVFNDPENELIKGALMRYTEALRGMNYTPKVTTVEKFAELLRAESKGNPVIASRIVDQSISKGWKALYPLKDKQVGGVVSVPAREEDQAVDENGDPIVF